MRRRPRIAASIVSANLARLGQEVTSAIHAGVDWLHVDVTDHHFASEPTVGPLVCAALRPVTGAPIDVHLRVNAVDALLPAFARSGADLITVHPESTGDLRRTLQLVKRHGRKAGVALAPATPLDVLDEVLHELALVLVMAPDVRPGSERAISFTQTRARVRTARERIRASGRDVLVEVEGPVDPESAAEMVQAGADVLVAGSAIFGAPDYAAAVAALKGCTPPRALAFSMGGAA